MTWARRSLGTYLESGGSIGGRFTFSSWHLRSEKFIRQDQSYGALRDGSDRGAGGGETSARGISVGRRGLYDGWQLVPLEDDDLDGLGVKFNNVLDGFNYLSDELCGFFEDLSRLGDFIYFETGYFGGAGYQAACAFSNGMIISDMRATGDGAINRALRCFGVAPTDGVDEFDHIGLSRFRHTTDWKEAARE